MKSFSRRLNILLNNNIMENATDLADFYYLLKTKLYYKRYFGEIGANSKIIMPMRLKNVQNIFIKKNVIVNKYSFLITVPSGITSNPEITIDEGAIIGHFNHIASVNKVYIGKNVLTADKVFISDHNHNYEDIKIPIAKQGTYSKGIVTIGDGSWIGENVCIISANIGKNCVIAANSVVSGTFPDYSIVAGVPGRVIKRFDSEIGRWEKN